MSLSGVHVSCGQIQIQDGTSLVGILSWSRTMPAPGTTDIAAANPAGSRPRDIVSTLGFEVSASVDVWVAWGTNPDAGQANGSGDSARIYVRAGETRNMFCNKGDKLAWAAA